MRYAPGAITCALVLAAGSVAAGEPTRAGGGRAGLSLTVSGGVSLGAYEAGFLFYAIAALHRDDAADLRLLTGASAGSLNALLALLEACGAEGPSAPAGSMFWRTWIPAGLDQLFVPPPSTPLGAFSRQWLDRTAASIEEAWRRGVDASCDVVLGISTTRVEPRLLRAAGGQLDLPRMEEKFAVRIQGRGPGRPPRASNYAVPSGPWREPLLVTDARGEIPFAELRDLIIASMSFPVAFAPQPLRTCIAGETRAPGVCPEAEARTASYVDGGVFDNTPLRFAVRLARMGLHRPDVRSGRLRWKEAPDPSVLGVPAEVAFTSVDPDATEYPSTPPPEPSSEEPSLPHELHGLLKALVDTARSKELATLLEEHPEVAGRMVLPRRHFPAASAPLGAFLGFLETEFRIFDFHLGMYDARKLIAGGVRTADGALFIAPSPAGAAGDEGTGWERFACMRAVYDGTADAAEACRPAALADFRVLLQASLDQLYDACRVPPARGDRSGWRNDHCARAARGDAPPRVPGLAPSRRPDWRRRAAETELEYSMRLLAAYGFRFADLGVPPGRGDLAVARIRSELGRVGRELAAAQPDPHRRSVAFLAKLAADTLAYSPPDHALHVTVGPTESELGLSRGFFASRWLPPGFRVAFAGGFRGLEEAFSSGAAEPFAAILVGGLELQPRGRSILAQLRFGLRGGWLLAADDDYGAGRCEDRGARSVSSCSRPVVQALVGLTAIERFRMQLVGEWFPGTATRSAAWSVAPGIGLELGF